MNKKLTRYSYSSFIPLPLSINLVGRVGFEPTINGLKVRCLKPDLATDLRDDFGIKIADCEFINPKLAIPIPKSNWLRDRDLNSELPV
jgi:hypothetical protein